MNQITPFLEDMRRWCATQKNAILKRYFEFLRFPTVSADPSSFEAMQNCVGWLSNQLHSMGFQNEQWPPEAAPILFSQRRSAHASAPTLLIYNHYDVQPIDPVELWQSSPFEPTEKNGFIFARGAQDNKGQCLYVLESLRLLTELYPDLPLHLKICIDSEEEMGSPHLSAQLKQRAQQLRADHIAVIDVGIQERNHPSLTLGLRGILTLDVKIRTAFADLHSGVHGGLALNAAQVLTNLLAKLHDENGAVAIPGFYDAVRPITDEMKEKIDLAFSKKNYTKITGGYPEGGEKNYSPLERSWWRPTLEINGLSSGYQGSGFKTVLPASASAKLSCRLVADQDPKKIGELVRSYLLSLAPPNVNMEVTIHPGKGKSVRTSANTPIVEAFSSACSHIFNKPCNLIYDGASIPIAAELQNIAQGDLLLFGLGLPTDQIHAPNEHFDWERIEQGILITALALYKMSQSNT